MSICPSQFDLCVEINFMRLQHLDTTWSIEHTDTHDIELETTLQQLPLDLGSNAVETNMAVGENGRLLR